MPSSADLLFFKVDKHTAVSFDELPLFRSSIDTDDLHACRDCVLDRQMT